MKVNIMYTSKTTENVLSLQVSLEKHINRKEFTVEIPVTLSEKLELGGGNVTDIGFLEILSKKVTGEKRSSFLRSCQKARNFLF